MFEGTPSSDVASASMCASVTAAVLRAGRLLHQVSFGLSCLMLGEVVVCHVSHRPVPLPAGLAAVLCFGAAEMWFAMRVAVDADFFALLAGRSGEVVAFDHALTVLKLRRPATAERTVEDRSRGAMRLLRWQGLLLVAQTLCLGGYLLAN